MHCSQGCGFKDADICEQEKPVVTGDAKAVHERVQGAVVQPVVASHTHAPLRVEQAEEIHSPGVFFPAEDDLRLQVCRGEPGCS